MKIAAINGSPKGLKSNSNEILSIIRSFFPEDTEWKEISQIRVMNKIKNSSLFEELYSCEVLLIAFPLYIDSIPASLMHLLEEYAKGYKEISGSDPGNMPAAVKKNQWVFAVANCGFYEGRQNETALKMIEFFCKSTGLFWCGGAGIGTGEMILELKNVPPDAGIKRPVLNVLKKIANAISRPDGQLEENIYTQHNFPWLLFKLAGEFGWRQQAKKAGLSARDMAARPLLEKFNE